MRRIVCLFLLLLGGAAALPVASAAQAFAPPGVTFGTPVDDEALRRAAPEEWLTYGHDYAETRFSTLDEIDTQTVSRLGLEWTWEITNTAGRLESTPLVSNGVMYASGTFSKLFALDARTGETIWVWDPAIVRGGFGQGGPSYCCGPNNRGLAIYEGRVYAGLLDGRLVALDAETGELVWARQTTPPGTDYSITGAPRIVKGNVIIGNGGAEYGVRGFVTAYDAETGEEVWRFYTVPGNPAAGFESISLQVAATTWSGEWWALGGGGTAWDAMAYDPDLDLLYVGTGNGSPWSREYRSQGVGDNLYLSSILALDPDDGELVWYYQTTPGDDWDYTATQHVMLADLTIAGVPRQVLMTAPKNGFFYVIDRRTGDLISAEPYAHVTWATRIDLTTGRPVEAPGARYDETGSWISPGPLGAHNWEPMAYSPETGLVYLPGQNSQSFYRHNPAFTPGPGRFNTGTGGGTRPPAPPAPTPAGYLVAWDPVQQAERWRIPYSSGRNAGALATAGGLVFTGDSDGNLVAYDAATGEERWSYLLAPGLASPMTFELDGRQYLTMLGGGTGGSTARVWTFVLDGDTPRPVD
jgi:PQQ-dependent dehydrogenase (methanol/ethanol family)